MLLRGEVVVVVVCWGGDACGGGCGGGGDDDYADDSSFAGDAHRTSPAKPMCITLFSALQFSASRGVPVRLRHCSRLIFQFDAQQAYSGGLGPRTHKKVRIHHDTVVCSAMIAATQLM